MCPRARLCVCRQPRHLLSRVHPVSPCISTAHALLSRLGIDFQVTSGGAHSYLVRAGCIRTALLRLLPECPPKPVVHMRTNQHAHEKKTEYALRQTSWKCEASRSQCQVLNTGTAKRARTLALFEDQHSRGGVLLGKTVSCPLGRKAYRCSRSCVAAPGRSPMYSRTWPSGFQIGQRVQAVHGDSGAQYGGRKRKLARQVSKLWLSQAMRAGRKQPRHRRASSESLSVVSHLGTEVSDEKETLTDFLRARWHPCSRNERDRRADQ